MVELDMNKAAEDLPEEGVYLLEVKDAQTKTARSGSAMISVQYKMRDRDVTVWDNIMLEGGGWKIGKPKLAALGVPSDFKGNLNPLDLVGKRVWAALKRDTYDGRDRMSVDINKLKYCGLQPESMMPEGASMGEAVGETPF